MICPDGWESGIVASAGRERAMPERRRRTRVPFVTHVDIETVGARLLELETRDLSHKGVFVKGSLPLKPGQGCTVTIHLPGDIERTPQLVLEGRVVRVTEEGAAIDFLSMDPDTFLHLRNIVLFNTTDPDKVQREFATPAFEDDTEAEK